MIKSDAAWLEHRVDRLWRALLVAFAVLSIVVFVYTTRRGTFPDAAYYRPVDGWDLLKRVDLSGRTYSPPWVLTLFYGLAGSDVGRYIAQAAVSAVAWAFLATQLRAVVVRKAVGTFLAALVLIVALSPAITNWNSLILSESLAISLAAILVGVSLRLVTRRTSSDVAWFLLVAVLFAFSRPNTLPVLGVMVAAMAVWAVLDGGNRSLAVASAIGLVLVTSWAVWRVSNTGETFQESKDTYVTYSQGLFYVNLAYRILPYPEARQWMREQGMPACEALPDVPPEQNKTTWVIDVYKASSFDCSEQFQEWADAEGLATYLKWIVTHPAWSWRRLVRDTPAMMTPVSYTPAVSPLPMSVDHLIVATMEPSYTVFRARSALFAYNWNWYEPLLLWLVAATVVLVYRKRVVDWYLAGVGLTVLVASVGYIVASWMVMPHEFERHGIPANIVIRIAPLILIAAAFARSREPELGGRHTDADVV